ncbi:MAG: tetratricopeptide repeat protein [Capsulimonadales bacterium]|nr:tetratricopeptide repeat protein [Capsulimonadales bacterium]
MEKRRRYFAVSWLVGWVWLTVTGCENPEPTSSPSVASPSAAVSASPSVPALPAVPADNAVEEVPPPPDVPEPHPTREEMAQMRKALYASPGPPPPEALRLAGAIGDMAKEEAILRTMADAKPTDRSLRYRLGDVLLRQLKLREARKLYEELQSRDPGSPFACMGLAEERRLGGDLAAARSYLAKGAAALADDPKNVPGMLLLAERFRILKDAAGARALLDRALRLRPKSPDILLKQAILHQDAKETAAYRTKLGEVLAADPGNIEARRRLAASIAENPADASEVETAGRLLVEVFQSGKPTPEDFMTSGRLLERDGDWPKTVVSYVQLLTADPENVTGWYRLSRAYGQLGKKEYAAQAQAQYDRLNPEQEKRGDLARIRANSPLSPAAHLAEAEFAEKTKDYRIAVIAYDQAARLAPDNRRVRQARAAFYRSLGWPAPTD